MKLIQKCSKACPHRISLWHFLAHFSRNYIDITTQVRLYIYICYNRPVQNSVIHWLLIYTTVKFSSYVRKTVGHSNREMQNIVSTKLLRCTVYKLSMGPTSKLNDGQVEDKIWLAYYCFTSVLRQAFILPGEKRLLADNDQLISVTGYKCFQCVNFCLLDCGKLGLLQVTCLDTNVCVLLVRSCFPLGINYN